MDTDRWRRIGEVFEAVSGLEGEALERALDERCGDDEALRREAVSLLEADTDAEAWLAGLTARSGIPAPEAEAALNTPGRTIGAWRLVRQIGRGGMGVVYLAERADEQFKMRAALKALPVGLITREAVARFQREREILAQLNHPNIARLLDGGVTPEGTPFYVMEYVEGLTLHRYCQEHPPSLDARIRLFEQMAAAVAYAHRHLVIHRDIKPANILVTRDGAPKLLDFGVAKLVDAEAPDTATATQVAHRRVTPAYTAPELLQGEPVTTACDVYSLGVVLYELLAGTPPFEPEFFKQPGWTDRLAEYRPMPPSRAAEDRALKHRLKGDLDTIVAMAMHPDPARRYATVNALLADLERHRKRLPVSARPDSLAYRASRFVRRHAVGVGLGSAAVAALCVALTVSIAQTRRAEAALSRSNAVQEFLLGVFNAAEPAPGGSGIMTQRDLAERAVRQLDQQLADQPQTRIGELIAVGRVFRKLGFPGRSQRLLQSALETLDAVGASDHDPRRVEALLALGRADYYLDDYEAGVRHLSRADILAARAGTPVHQRASILFELGSSYSALRQIDAALKTLSEAQRLASTTPEAAGLVPRVRLLTALTFRRAGRLDEAIRAGEQAVDSARRRLGDDHIRTAGALNTVGAIFRRAGRLEEAEKLQREALQIEIKAHGQPQSATVNNLARVLLDRGRLEESGALYRQALELAIARYGPESSSTASYRRNLALQQALAGNLEQAVANLRQAYHRYAENHRVGTVTNLRMRSELAWVLQQAGHDGEARELLPEIFAEAPAHEDKADDALRKAHMVAASLALRRGEPEKALVHVEAAEDNLHSLGLETVDLVRLQILAGEVACALGDESRANDRWQQAVSTTRDNFGPGHPLADAATHSHRECPSPSAAPSRANPRSSWPSLAP